MMLNNKALIVVLGMHRSGTSAITRGLKVLGVELGDNLMPPQQDNEKGFWEDLDIYALNNEILAHFNNNYHDLEPIYPEILEKGNLNPFKIRAIELLRNKSKLSTCFGFKDPRIARILPFWMSVFEHLDREVFYVISLRNPMSIVRSLAKRNEFSHEKGYILWQEHLLFSLKETRGKHRLIVDFDNLIQDPARELQRIAQTVGLTFDANHPHFIDYKTTFLEESLRHTQFQPQDLLLEPCLSNEMKQLFNFAFECAADKISIDSKEAIQTIDQLYHSSKNHYPLLRYASRIEKKIEEQACQITEWGIAVDSLKAQLQNQINLSHQNETQANATRSDLQQKLQDQIDITYQNEIKAKTFYADLQQKLQNQIDMTYQSKLQAKAVHADLQQKLQNQIDINHQNESRAETIQAALKEQLQKQESQSIIDELRWKSVKEDLERQLQNQINVNNQRSIKARKTQDEMEEQLIDLKRQIKDLHQQDIQAQKMQDDLKKQLQNQINCTSQHDIQTKKIMDDLKEELENQMGLLAQSDNLKHALQLELDNIKTSFLWKILKIFSKSAARTKNHQSKTSLASTTLPLTKQRSSSNTMITPLDSPINTVDDILLRQDTAFIHAAYYALLKRTPDEGGITHYRQQLRMGVEKIQILSQIYQSKEAKYHAVQLPGLKKALRKHRLQNIPILGMLKKKRLVNIKLNSLENQLGILHKSNTQLREQFEKSFRSVNDLFIQQEKKKLCSNVLQRFGYHFVDIQTLFEKLLSVEETAFLHDLFLLTLKRFPLEHEMNHYLSCLKKGESRLDVIHNVLFCEESLTSITGENPADSEKITVKETLPFPAPSFPIISFTAYPNPLVSIIIPVYGKIDYTLSCLQSIYQHQDDIEFELIVVDDLSPDNTLSVLTKIPGLRIIANPENMGFIRSCNLGAHAAKGQYLHFLNNDTEVTAHWLKELINTFISLPGTGLVGSKLIYPDGVLQEAGSIIWQDGSAWNFGRHQDPSLPIYNYAREVDYCSGASILLTRDLFNQLGGFDEHYLPAYCEDADLALKIKEKGYRVIYQPFSVVIHHEGISSGTRTTEGIKSYQIQNTEKLFSRWESRLKHHQRNGEDVDNAKDRGMRRRVLVLDHCTPTPDQDAGSVTALNLMILLSSMGFIVTFIPEDNFLYMPEYTPLLQKIGIEVLYAPYCTSVKQHLMEWGNRYELALLFRPVVAERHMKTVRQHCKNIKILYHAHDLHFLRMSREATLQNNPKLHQAVKRMKHLEFDTILQADASIIHSETEIEMLQRELHKAKTYLFPLTLSIPGTQHARQDRHDIVFIGGSAHPPNIDAIQYLVKDVMPLLRKQLPGVRLYVVGNNPHPDILDLATDDVILTGIIKELPPFLDKIRVAVAPLRYGAGIKGKIGCTMASGLPTIATSIATEGMALTHEENILIADTKEAIADSICRAYLDESLWCQLSRASITFANKTWGAKTTWNILSNILNQLDITVAHPSYPLVLFPFSNNHASLLHHQTNTNGSENFLTPIARVYSRREFHQVISSPTFDQLNEIQSKLLQTAQNGPFTVEGLCRPCNKSTLFTVDFQSGSLKTEDQWTPNWRERVVCPFCGMNNRQRLIAALVQDHVLKCAENKLNIYLMEHITPISLWIQKNILSHEITTSEYLGKKYQSGQIINGVRHEDLMRLSFSDHAFDLIISNDVFEHVPQPTQAFRECARILAPGGTMIATFPFHTDNEVSIVRAQPNGEKTVHYLEPVYHGNPLFREGSLVYTDFGWDILKTFEKSGFSDVHVSIYASEEFGHYGDDQIIFEAKKSLDPLKMLD